MTVIAKLDQLIGRIQAVPDRHLAGLYAALAVLTALCARANSTAAGLVIAAAFFVVGAMRAIKHPTLADMLLAFVIGAATGAGAFGMVHTLDASVTGPRTGLVLISFAGVAFAYSSALVSPLVRLIAERGRVVAGG